MGRLLDLAKRVGQSARMPDGETNERSEITPDAAPPAGPYYDLCQEALHQLCQPDYAAGMIPWLGQAHPELYEELISSIPDEIHLAWTAHAPLEMFDWILVRLVETHRRACGLYQAHHAGREKHPEQV